MRRVNIIAISGSLRAGSSNSALLRAVTALAPTEVAFTFYEEQIGRLPHFNPDLDGEGAVPPPLVAELRARLAEADGVFISTPEYAHGVPGSLKNALDWIVSSGELTDKPVALIVASPGGGQLAQTALAETLRVMGARLVVDATLPFARRDVDADNRVSDPDLAQKLASSLDALLLAVRAR